MSRLAKDNCICFVPLFYLKSARRVTATQSLTPALNPRDSTKPASVLLVIVIAIVVIGAGAAGFFLTAPRSTQSSTTSSSSVGTSVSSSTASHFKIYYDTIIVGYQGGLFQLSFSDSEGKQIAGVVAVLNTPYQAAMCSGGGAVALGFGNCLPGPGKTYVFSAAVGGSFPANTTFTGMDTGRGPGSAVVGQSYPLIITATYADGTTSSETISVAAVAG